MSPVVETVMRAIDTRTDAAALRYGPFTSSHEAMGVASEEWDEFRDAVRANDLAASADEALDLAAVLIRYAVQVRSAADSPFVDRSMK